MIILCPLTDWQTDRAFPLYSLLRMHTHGILYSALILRNLNFADSCLQSLHWINFAVPFALPQVLSKVPHLQCVSWYTHVHTPYYHAHKLIWQLFIRASRNQRLGDGDVATTTYEMEAIWLLVHSSLSGLLVWLKANIDGLVHHRYCTRRNDSSKWAIRIGKLWIMVAWINSWKVLQ